MTVAVCSTTQLLPSGPDVSNEVKTARTSVIAPVEAAQALLERVVEVQREARGGRPDRVLKLQNELLLVVELPASCGRQQPSLRVPTISKGPMCREDASTHHPCADRAGSRA